VLRHNGSFVFRINEDDTAEQVAVELGDSSGDLIAVRGSLQAGDRVAIRGAENLRDGMATKILVSSLDNETGNPDG
jgi:multidrug efflux pump subunit AcrA (membrane-fusion protein)